MAMTVSELRAMLADFPDDMEVKISYNYGDHWCTQVAPSIEAVETVIVGYSTTHRMDAICDSGAPFDEETEEPTESELHKQVLIIR